MSFHLIIDERQFVLDGFALKKRFPGAKVSAGFDAEASPGFSRETEVERAIVIQHATETNVALDLN